MSNKKSELVNFEIKFQKAVEYRMEQLKLTLNYSKGRYAILDCHARLDELETLKEYMEERE